MDEQWTQTADADETPEQPDASGRPEEAQAADGGPPAAPPERIRHDRVPDGGSAPPETLHPQLARELEAIRALDPDVRDFTDLTKMESFPRFIELAQRGTGFLDAFRAANFDAIVRRTERAARQAAVNELRSTSHFEPVGGGAEPASDLTQEEMDWWKAFGFSEKKAKYYHNKYKKER